VEEQVKQVNRVLLVACFFLATYSSEMSVDFYDSAPLRSNGAYVGAWKYQGEKRPRSVLRYKSL
jgi:hypothetical protein